MNPAEEPFAMLSGKTLVLWTEFAREAASNTSTAPSAPLPFYQTLPPSPKGSRAQAQTQLQGQHKRCRLHKHKLSVSNITTQCKQNEGTKRRKKKHMEEKIPSAPPAHPFSALLGPLRLGQSCPQHPQSGSRVPVAHAALQQRGLEPPRRVQPSIFRDETHGENPSKHQLAGLGLASCLQIAFHEDLELNGFRPSVCAFFLADLKTEWERQEFGRA